MPGPTTAAFLDLLGVPHLAPATTPFDPGYDPATLTSHLAQSSHLMNGLKISMACWLVADESVTRAKVAAARRYGVAPLSGGGPFEIANSLGCLPQYLDLCADIGFSRIEAGEGFTRLNHTPAEVVRLAQDRGLGVQCELGSKLSGSFDDAEVAALLDQGRAWLDAGADELVVEARESAAGVGLFGESGALDTRLADRFAEAFGLSKVVYEAPTKPSQFALLDHLGAEVRLANVRLEELLRVEIYRRGLHADAFAKGRLAPPGPTR
ncbi:MAG TPA: phosphosulfolactate synthase [Acidimicrobiales bacterium]|nr:phosphosulfolactate synthase [Acidimicrobiales bacterium]